MMNAYALWLMRYRWGVIVITLLLTGGLAVMASGLKVIIDPAALAPQGHPYIQATNHVDAVFGSKYLMLIGITPREGDAFQPAVLERVQRLTRQLETTPGVVKSTLLSLAASQAKAIQGNPEGFTAKPLLSSTEPNAAQIQDMKAAVMANPVYRGTVISNDWRTAAILVELKERPDGFQKMVAPVNALVEAERSPDVEITLGGNPIYLDQTETFSQRMDWLFPLALLMIGLLHFEAFRTKQGLILPLVTALMAVAWGTGFMGLLKQPLDIFNSPTPILILAVAAGHAVQLLKRYYEEFEALRKTNTLSPEAANQEAVVRSLVAVGPVMAIAGLVAALGFFSLMVFDIATIRSFGLFTGTGILSAVLLEVSFIPAVRSLLRAPSDTERATETRVRIWDRVPAWIADQVIPARRRALAVGSLLVLGGLCALATSWVVVDNASKRYFADDLPLQRDDAFLNRQLGGTQSLYVMVEGKGPDSIKSPEVLRGIAHLQRFAEQHSEVGKTVSVVDYLRRMNQAVQGEQTGTDILPASRELVSQYLLLYALSGQPGDFDSVVDYDYKAAKITLLLKTGSNAYIKQLVSALEAEARQQFGPDITVSFGGDVTQTIALTDTMVQGKLLNILQISLAVFIISALAFRSVVAGLLVLIPLGLSVVAIFGVMGASGIPLNIPNALISAMAVGIGADYAIYLLHRIRELVRAGLNPEDAVRRALATAGKATLFVATAVAGGYGVLALSWGFHVHQWLAMFIVLAMVVSAISSLVLLPSLVLWFKPRFIFGGAAQPRWAPALWWLTVGGLATVLSGLPEPAQAEPDALQVMEKSRQATRVKDSQTNATFTLTNKDGNTRVRQTNGSTKLRTNGNDNLRLVRFTAPADINGTATLLMENGAGEDDLWIYLPALGKVRRLSATNKRDAFVGTDFSFGDVIGHRPSDWRHRWLRDEAVDGAPCHVIESLPATPATQEQSGYSKMVSWVRQDNFVAAKIEFSDPGGQPLKRITARDIRAVGQGHWQPMTSSAENLQTGHRTLIEFSDFKADMGVSDQLFTTRSLER